VSAGPCRPLTVRLRAAKKLTFRIKNTMGATIPDASLLSANGFVRAKADNNGKMEVLFPAEANAMDCTVYARGYIAHSFSLDPTDSVQELVLEKAAEFSGSVVSETGAPIEGAVVTVIGSGGRTGAAAKVKTNTAGWFSIFPASPPVVSIKVAKDGYMERQIGIDPKPTIDKVSIVLEKTRSGFFGRVFLSNGEPAHQFVMAIANSNNKGQLFVRHVEDADGSFQISDIPLGTYHVTIKVAKPFEVGEIKDLELREGSYFGPIEVKLSAYLARKKIG
jgi:hypothetical protein